ncbi:MAG: GIY-YIG nuclease family protein [Spirochaetes bacterium]|nr:GIY-YIG nuclease family protein [Spirochaetota bacterium]
MNGVYRIVNIKNGKSYIGQSKDIYRRWKQHTSALTVYSNETILRKAFVKYGMLQQVFKEGQYGCFRFEIIEECSPNELLEREYYYIDLEKPAYNLMFLPPNELVKLDSKRRKHAGKYYIQYHNYDVEKHFPGIDENNLGIPISDISHYISSRKNLAAYLDGANVVLVIGISINNNKLYYIWTRTNVDDLEFIKEENNSYNIIGFQEFIKPVCLNRIEGFRPFQKRLGNFAYGLSSINGYDFTKIIIDICEKQQVHYAMPCKDYLDLYKKEFICSSYNKP